MIETSNLDIPDRVPVGVVLAVVRHLTVASAANRVDSEEGTIASVVERVEDEANVVVPVKTVLLSRRISVATSLSGWVSQQRNET
jgi:hypothetical protein